MVTKDELHKSYKIKVLLKGGSGTGKTFCAVKSAGYVADRGFKVLYLDYEKGSIKELLELSDDTLQNIIHEDFCDYKTMVNALNTNIKEEKDLKLVVIDPMPLVEIARLSAADAFLDQGYYYIGEKRVEISNKETFDLRGYMYQLPNSWVLRFLTNITIFNQDVICTLATPNKYETDYDGKFDVVFDCYNAWVGNNIFYKAIPKKMRGVDLSNFPAIDNPHKKLLEAFEKKYSLVKPENK